MYCTKIFLDLNAADVETLDAEKLIAWKIRQGLAEDVEIPEALLQYSGLEEEITFAQESPCCAIYFNILPPNTEVRPSPFLPSPPLLSLAFQKKEGICFPPFRRPCTSCICLGRGAIHGNNATREKEIMSANIFYP